MRSEVSAGATWREKVCTCPRMGSSNLYYRREGSSSFKIRRYNPVFVTVNLARDAFRFVVRNSEAGQGKKPLHSGFFA